MLSWVKTVNALPFIRIVPAVSTPAVLAPSKMMLELVPPMISESSGLVITSRPLLTVWKSSPTLEPTAAVKPLSVRVPLTVMPEATSRPFRA